MPPDRPFPTPGENENVSTHGASPSVYPVYAVLYPFVSLLPPPLNGTIVKIVSFPCAVSTGNEVHE